MITDDMIRWAVLCTLLEEFAERRDTDVSDILDTVFTAGVAAADGNAAKFYRTIKKAQEIDIPFVCLCF